MQDIRIPTSILREIANKLQIEPDVTEMRFETVTGQVLKMVRRTGRHKEDKRQRFPRLPETWDSWDFYWNPED